MKACGRTQQEEKNIKTNEGMHSSKRAKEGTESKAKGGWMVGDEREEGTRNGQKTEQQWRGMLRC